MRSVLVALCVLASNVAAAQPVVTAEIVATPGSISALDVPAPPVAIATDKHGVAIAWSAQGRIRIARLDAFGRIAGDVRILPILTTRTTADAHHPSLAVAPSGEGFVLAWMETRPNTTLGAFAFLNAALEPEGAAFLPVNRVKTSILVRTGSAKVWIAADHTVWEVERPGQARATFNVEWPIQGLAVAGDEPTAISRELSSFRCTCATSGGVISVCPESCKNYHHTVVLRLDQRFASTRTRTFFTDTRAEAAVAAEGNNLLLAWMGGTQTNGGNVVLATIPASQPASFGSAVETPLVVGTFAPDFGTTRPDVAGNGKRRVVVWRNKSGEDHDIVGAVVDANGAITRFDIATSDADERDPSVFALPNGNFLVAYEKGNAQQSSVAWRFILFEGRRRAVR